jgi:hypothetical protein
VGGSLDILKPEGGNSAISKHLGGRLDICRNNICPKISDKVS